MVTQYTINQYVLRGSVYIEIRDSSITENDIDTAISEAIQIAKSREISGKEVTPFLLSEIGKITENKSLNTSNEQLN